MKKYLECGKITTTHGINGAVKVSSLCDSPYILAELKTVYIEQLGVYRPLTVNSSSVYKDTVIFSFDGINSIDNASKLKNRTLFAFRDDILLEDGAYFLADIIGLDVIDFKNGKIYGKVAGVNTNAPQLLYEIETPNGIKLLPAVDAFVKNIVLDEAIYVTPVPGLLDEDYQ